MSRPFMVAPERERRRRKGRSAMLLDKNVLLEQIRALDFEYETGKLPTEIYEAQREMLVQETAVILKKLDAAPVSNGNSANLDAKIEAAISQIRGQHPTAVAAAPAKVAVEAGSAGFCPQCGNPADVDDKFCSTCGNKLV